MVRTLVSIVLPAIASACSCVTSGPPCQAAWKTSAVFAGTVVGLTRDTMQPDSRGAAQVNGFLGTHALFEVAEGFIGMEGRGQRIEIRTGMGGGDCGYPFERGERYVVYANETKDGLLVATICSRTAPEARAQSDLAYLRGLPNAGPLGYIYGIAGNGQEAGRFDQAQGMWAPAGIPGVDVTLTGSGKSARLTTGDDGAFRFDRLAPGKYNVSVTKDGYSSPAKPAELELHAGGCAYVPELLVVDRRIAGKVTGADGFPAPNIQVELVPARPSGSNQLPFPVAQTRTAVDGGYELRNIRAGEYYLGINLVRTPSKEMPYTRYFYPGTEDPAGATLIIVENGARTTIHNFPIPPPQKQQTIEGFVSWPDGRPAENVAIMLEDIRLPWQTNVIAATTDVQGRFEVFPFDRTVYRVHAVTMARRTTESFSAEPLLLGPAGALTQPLRLILSRKGHSAAELNGKGLERWRAGLGF